MITARKIIIGARGSTLALAQTTLVANALRLAHSGFVIESKIITTKGDVDQSPIPLDTVGKAWFTEEIEQALLRGEIDLAVHSLKDLSPDLPSGLKTMAVLPRANAADVLVAKSGLLLKDLRSGAIVGTDSSRRRALILATRPDLVVQSIRGNIDTRLKKLETENYDAIVIAAAGLERLGVAYRITERFDPKVFIPAPGQGILAVEMREGQSELSELVNAIVHAPTAAVAEIEQAFSNAIGGGCKTPIGCYAEIADDQVKIYAAVGSMDGKSIVRKSKAGRLADGVKLAETLAGEFLQ